ncbi:GNAT family N-acetyltransferase [Thalassotalea sp. 1_MG-2023]|uniref:GNAT family N-acetyltransferase n=1 Tax=Thalassotalea sp. 1_MG-2023 TaxID=3062680 RepID=UPI0026E18D34|nr:GNAT family N-acetyltransferase [Thalassotalea sp. 1_MG-2023]MDO6425762.1 GNAT family N-acetyltransferase [Thalassotalea sp. 1_MG-2023]
MNIDNTERLSFRLMDKNDKQLLWQLDQDPEVMKFITGGQVSSMEKIEHVFIPRMEAYRNKEKGWGLWQVNLLADNSYLGWILIRPMHFFSDNPEFDNLEIGWRFFQHTWGKGYATEAAQQIMQALKSNNTFSAIADENNHASISVMKKLGMDYVKTYHHKDQLIDCQVDYYQIKK